MKSFFQGMNLARGVILASLLGSVVVGWIAFKEHAQMKELRDALASQVPTIVSDIQQLSEVHTKLTRDKDGDQFLRQATPELYIRGIGDKQHLSLGQLTLDPKRDLSSKGIVDQKYRIVPEKKDREYSRGQISEFLYYLEAESRRVKVTDVKIDLVDTRTKTHEVPRDAWTFEAEVTSRQKEGE